MVGVAWSGDYLPIIGKVKLHLRPQAYTLLHRYPWFTFRRFAPLFKVLLKPFVKRVMEEVPNMDVLYGLPGNLCVLLHVIIRP